MSQRTSADIAQTQAFAIIIGSSSVMSWPNALNLMAASAKFMNVGMVHLDKITSPTSIAISKNAGVASKIIALNIVDCLFECERDARSRLEG